MRRAAALALLLTGITTVRAVAQPDDDDRTATTRARNQKPAAKPDTDDEDENEKAQPESAIVVTARRLDTARTSIDQGLGATVYELHNETIENRPGGETGSIGAILNQTPGVTLSSEGLNIRGSKAVQVRINGAFLPEAISDPEDRLSSRLAESTRLITGTLPAEFGFAPGGVIDVTTKNGLYQHGGQVELFAGTRGAFEPAVEWGGSAGSASLYASGSLELGDSRVADRSGPSAKDIRHEIGGLAFADHVIDPDNRVSLILGGSREHQGIGQTDLPAGTERTDDGYAVGTLQHSAKGFTLQASLFAGVDSNSADSATVQQERTTSAGTQVDSSLDAGGGNTLRAGLLLTRLTSQESGPLLDGSRAHRTSLGVYAGDEWKPLSQVTVNAGVRADWLRSPDSTAVVEPRASIVWEPAGGFSAHAGYARYASAAPLGEEPIRTRLPNERDDYLDSGVQQKLGPITLDADAYYRSVHHLILEHRVPGQAVRSAFAFARGRFRGVDLSATYARGPVSAWVNLSFSKSQGRTIVGGATLFPAASLSAANGHWINLASDRPLTASAGVSWRIGKLNLSGDLLAGSGVVRTFDPAHPNGDRAAAFATFGLAAVYHSELFNQPLDLRMDLANLTDVREVTNDAANFEGGWTRFEQGRSILVGFEQGF